jgi:hypothetical protein
MGVRKEEEGKSLAARAGDTVQAPTVGDAKNKRLLIQKQNPRNRFLGAVQTQPVVVIFLVFPHSSGAQLFLN